MKKREIFTVLIELKRKFIESLSAINNGKSFTRKRKLFLARLLIILLRCSPCGLQIRLDDYFKKIGHVEDTVTKKAFSKARTNLDPNTVKASFELTARTLSSCDDCEYYREKYRLSAMDGSDLVLDNAMELLEHFGGSGSNKDCATAMVSICYDPLNDIILDGGLYPYGTSEREAARKHIEVVESMPLPRGVKNLYVFDRGYPSKEFFAEMIKAGRCFLMRVRRNSIMNSTRHQ